MAIATVHELLRIRFVCLAHFQEYPNMSVVTTSHIWLDDRNVAWIDQTNIKVIEVALERLAHGSSVEEIVEQHKGLMSLAQVHSALAYYYDHELEFNSEIEAQLTRAAQQRSETLSSPGRTKLRQLGRI